jgi:diacylglycerol kinase family enzyme
MNVTLLLNRSTARRTRDVDALLATVEAAGHNANAYLAKGEDLERGLERSSDLVAVAGGDGTVGRVIKALAGRSVTLAILPYGTANNIATSLGIRGTPAELVPRWTTATCRRVDVGSARGPWGEIPFVESVGIGLLGHLISPEIGDDLEDTAAARNEARRLARSMRAVSRRVELDGEDLSGEFLLLEAMNIRCAGPNLWLADRARAGDGRLEIVSAGESERATLVALADAFGTSRATLPTRSGRRLRLWCELQELHVDDRHGPDLHDGEGLVQVDVELTDAGVDILV